MTIAYLGPPGTFTHAAIDRLATLEPLDLQCRASAVEIIDAVEGGDVDYGLVPIENSVEGLVIPTLDRLVFSTTRVFITEEVVLPVTFVAHRVEGASGPVRVAVSHPHALAQCRGYITREGLDTRTVASTAEACAAVARSGDPRSVAIASPPAGRQFGLVPAAERIEDFPGARTRFGLLARHVAPRTGSARTLLVLTPPDDHAGVLAELLGFFASRGLGLTSITSRPLRSHLGAYCFLLTVRGHIRDAPMGEAVDDLLAAGASVKLLGSFPGAVEPAVTVPFPVRPPSSLTAQSPPEARRRFFQPATGR